MAAATAAVLIVSGTGAPAQTFRSSYFWQGPYVGVNLGYLWGSVSGNATQPSGFAGGAQVGYNWLNQQFVFGVETDLQISGAEDVFAPWKFSNPWFGTLRGRGGFLLNDSALFYATAGLAYGSLRAQSTITGVTESKFHPGWTIGLGVEMMVSGNWTAKAEYLYVNLYDRAYSITGADNGMDASLLRMGVNYRF